MIERIFQYTFMWMVEDSQLSGGAMTPTQDMPMPQAVNQNQVEPEAVAVVDITADIQEMQQTEHEMLIPDSTWADVESQWDPKRVLSLREHLETNIPAGPEPTPTMTEHEWITAALHMINQLAWITRNPKLQMFAANCTIQNREHIFHELEHQEHSLLKLFFLLYFL